MEPSQAKARFDVAYLQSQLKSIYRSETTEIEFAPLQGDASTRNYFRVGFHLENGSQDKQSVIVMQLEKPCGDQNDFSMILTYLQGLRLPVPQLHAFDGSNGLLFLEDCGDVTLETGIRDASLEEKKVLYRQAVELLASLQKSATQNIGGDCPVFYLRFDVDKLMAEIDFMIEYYLQGLKLRALSPGQISVIRSRFKPLCQTLATQKLYFAHRDYHSRNLMLKNGKLVMLDFQDARMGPCQYDLVSLLRDSYVTLEDDFVEEMINHFIGLKEESGETIDRDAFWEIFDLMSIQRNMKAVGTFAFQSVEKQNDRYLQYIAPTLGYVKKTFDKRPDLAPLRESLSLVIPEVEGSDS